MNSHHRFWSVLFLFARSLSGLIHNRGPKKSVLSKEAESVLRNQFHLDYQLYDYVNQRLDAQMAQMIAELKWQDIDEEREK